MKFGARSNSCILFLNNKNRHETKYMATPLCIIYMQSMFQINKTWSYYLFCLLLCNKHPVRGGHVMICCAYRWFQTRIHYGGCWTGLGAITQITGYQKSATTNQEICRSLRCAKQPRHFLCVSVRNERLNHWCVQSAHASVLPATLPIPRRFDFIECFTTTFLRAHSWLNWVDRFHVER